jgi:AcrR family transcriptional regulator
MTWRVWLLGHADKRSPVSATPRAPSTGRAARAAGSAAYHAVDRRSTLIGCTPIGTPAYTRLDVDERRRQLLELGAELFTRHSYDELSMARIAREAGISKALLYHYFPSKQDFFVATLQQGAQEIARRTQPDPDLPPMEALAGSLDAFLGWIEENELAYRKLMESVGSVPEVQALLDEIRNSTSSRILAGIAGEGEPEPALRAAVRGWLWFMDGAVLDWIEHRDIDRPRLHGLLLGTLLGAVTASGAQLSY